MEDMKWSEVFSETEVESMKINGTQTPMSGNAMMATGDPGDDEEGGGDVDSWLGPDFLENVLREALKEPYLEVVRGKVWPEDDDLLGPEENRCAEEALVRRVWAEWVSPGRAGDVSLVVKAEPGGAGGQTLRRLRFFAKERRVYATALPDMRRLQERATPVGAPLPPPLASTYYPSPRHDALVIQDLRAEGFQSIDPRFGLDLQHSYAAMIVLAQFHARSIAMRHQRPDALLDFRENFFTADNDSLADSLEPALGALAAAVDTWPGYERFGDKIRALRRTAVARMVEAMKPDGARPLVLNHGDFWTGSLLYKYDERGGAVNEVRLINFQLVRWGSPALDLQFFIHTSPTEDVRAKGVDRLLVAYHGALASALASLKRFSEVPSLGQLKTEMNEKAIVGVLAALCVLGRLLADPQRPGDEVHGTKYRQVLQRMLPIFESQGLL